MRLLYIIFTALTVSSAYAEVELDEGVLVLTTDNFDE
jgi:hypothetical protein